MRYVHDIGINKPEGMLALFLVNEALLQKTTLLKPYVS